MLMHGHERGCTMLLTFIHLINPRYEAAVCLVPAASQLDPAPLCRPGLTSGFRGTALKAKPGGCDFRARLSICVSQLESRRCRSAHNPTSGSGGRAADEEPGEQSPRGSLTLRLIYKQLCGHMASIRLQSGRMVSGLVG